MPFTLKKFLQQYFKNRKTIATSPEQFALIVNGFFECALQDKEIAVLLLSEDNRIVQKISEKNDDDFLRFKAAHPDLFEQLLAKARLSEARSKVLRSRYLQDRLPLPDGGRTLLAVQRNEWLKRGLGDEISVSHNGIEYPMITRHTRDFNVGLCSVGSSSSREIIVLDPSSRLLQAYYSLIIKSAAEKCLSTQEVLQLVLRSTRNVFPSSAAHKLPEKPKVEPFVMLLDEFMNAGAGVCRHHTLLNAYVLSRLVADGILQGDVIHHRQNIGRGAHTWNIFQDKRDGKWYSLDSLWDKLICLDDNPGKVNEVYTDAHIEEKLRERYSSTLFPAIMSARSEPAVESKLPVEVTDGRSFQDNPVHQQNTHLKSLDAYYPYSDRHKQRFHLFSARKKNALETGDILKALILQGLITSLKESENAEETINNFKASDDYSVLSAGQGLMTRLLFNIFCCDRFKPTSLVAFDKICKDVRTMPGKSNK